VTPKALKAFALYLLDKINDSFIGENYNTSYTDVDLIRESITGKTESPIRLVTLIMGTIRLYKVDRWRGRQIQYGTPCKTYTSKIVVDILLLLLPPSTAQ
jgi:hypothetical protein